MLTGGCQCGAVRYAVTGEPGPLYACHCRECRKQSASAFGLSLIVARSAFRLTAGEVRTWSRTTDSGNALDCRFCPICGTRVWHQSPGGDTVSVKAGSLDRPVDLGTAQHIWVSRKLPGLVLPDAARCHDEEPG